MVCGGAYYGRERIVDLLLQHAAEMNAGAALAAAAHGGKERVVDLLLRRGAGINQRCGSSSRSSTPLIWGAAFYGHPAVVLRLLRAGADMTLRDVEGKTALQWAKEKGHAECVQAFRTHLGEVAASRSKAASADAGGAGETVGRASRAARRLSRAAAGQCQRRLCKRLSEATRRRALAWLDGGGRDGTSTSFRTAL